MKLYFLDYVPKGLTKKVLFRNGKPIGMPMVIGHNFSTKDEIPIVE